MSKKTEEKRVAIARLRELLHTMSTTEHDLWRLSIDTLKTLVERVEHVHARTRDESVPSERVANA